MDGRFTDEELAIAKSVDLCAVAESLGYIHNGKTMLTFLDSTKDYKLYDSQNRVVTTQKGTELYTHYDKVESTVRERYEKVQKQQKKTIQKKTVTTKKAR